MRVEFIVEVIYIPVTKHTLEDFGAVFAIAVDIESVLVFVEGTENVECDECTDAL